MRVAARALRRDVDGGADGRVGLRERRARLVFGGAEVAQADAARGRGALVAEDVLQLDVFCAGAASPAAAVRTPSTASGARSSVVATTAAAASTASAGAKMTSEWSARVAHSSFTRFSTRQMREIVSKRGSLVALSERKRRGMAQARGPGACLPQEAARRDRVVAVGVAGGGGGHHLVGMSSRFENRAGQEFGGRGRARAFFRILAYTFTSDSAALARQIYHNLYPLN